MQSLNFQLDQAGIKRQLSQLRMLVQAVDPHLASYLDTRDSGNLFFCFRWLLVLFKREFNYPQILRLWEVFWTDGPFHGDEDSYSATNFHLLVALSILDSQRNTILENRFGFTEILKVHPHNSNDSNFLPYLWCIIIIVDSMWMTWHCTSTWKKHYLKRKEYSYNSKILHRLV